VRVCAQSLVTGFAFAVRVRLAAPVVTGHGSVKAKGIIPMMELTGSAATLGRSVRSVVRLPARVGVSARAALTGGALLIIGGCDASLQPGGEGGPRVLSELPEEVVALAAPYQNLQNVELRPDDGCFWYLHEGPVETTRLPLRTAEGRPICARPGGAPAEEARTVRFERAAQPSVAGPDA